MDFLLTCERPLEQWALEIRVFILMLYHLKRGCIATMPFKKNILNNFLPTPIFLYIHEKQLHVTF
jgi:hypothetical protein